MGDQQERYTAVPTEETAIEMEQGSIKRDEMEDSEDVAHPPTNTYDVCDSHLPMDVIHLPLNNLPRTPRSKTPRSGRPPMDDACELMMYARPPMDSPYGVMACARKPMDSPYGVMACARKPMDSPYGVMKRARPPMDDGCEIACVALPLMSHPPIIPRNPDEPDHINIPGTSDEFTMKDVFEAASQGNVAGLHGLLDYLNNNKKHLTDPEFKEEANGKTALLKALLNLKNEKNDTIDVLLDIAEQTGDLKNLINASYTDDDYKGQTALHVAIDRRSFKYAKLLVEKGADVQAKANGEFFQPEAKQGFYFGELPLSLAACTDQVDIVNLLMKEGKADVRDQDSQGNTVLHILVIMGDNTEVNTRRITEMYDRILILHNELEKRPQNSKKDGSRKLEEIKNKQGLTPLKLAAKLGKIELLRHMLQREFKDEDIRHLSRRFTEWVYGPVHCSLYDISSVDTNECNSIDGNKNNSINTKENNSINTKENNSVLEIIVYGSDIENRAEMLEVEPLRSLLEEKWDMFASKMFLVNFLGYLIYLVIFTTVALCRKNGQPPFPVETPTDYLRCVGEIISVLGALKFLYQSTTFFLRNGANLHALFTEGFIDILFFLQAMLLLVSMVLYFCGRGEYVGLLVLSLAFAWINILYYSRGSKQLGKYYVMMQNMILGDLLQFLCVYSVFLFGFSVAVVALIDDPPLTNNDLTNAALPKGESFDVNKPRHNNLRYAILEMFKFTIGMGDLQFTDKVESKEVFYILLICYIVLTYILAFNMLIALMGNTVEKISSQSEVIWNLQRAFTILELERSLLPCLKKKLCVRKEHDEYDGRFRVEEKNWNRWTSDLGVKRKEDPLLQKPSGSHWNPEWLLERIRARHRSSGQNGIPWFKGNIELPKF